MPPLPTRPRYIPGRFPGDDFLESSVGQGTRLGVVTRVDALHMKADIKMLTGGGEPPEVDLTQALAGPRSFWGGLPEEGSLVVLAPRYQHRKLVKWVIVGYIPVGNKAGLRFDPHAPDDPANIAPEDAALYAKIIGKTIRYKRMKMHPGDVGGMSSAGSELLLSKDLRMCNRAGDLIELRDLERTLVTQAVHRAEAASGVRSLSGPARRFDFYLPPDIFGADGLTLKTEAERYFGRDELQAMGPGLPGTALKYADAEGKINTFLNNQNGEYPPVVYSNGRRAFYPSTVYGTSIEDGENGPGDAFVEHRMELTHQTDLSQEVLAEIDGLQARSRRVYIELALGTVVGNDPSSAAGIRQYGKVLKPQLWTSFLSTAPGKFSLEEVPRAAASDTETNTAAAGALFRMYCPQGNDEDNPFAVAVEKQGTLYINVPKPTVSRYPDASGVAVNANIQGAMKMFLGAADPTNTSLHFTASGGIKADIGHNTDTGNAIDVVFRCGTSVIYTGNPNDNDLALQQDIRGNALLSCTGDSIESIDGTKSITASNKLALQGERVNINGTSGFAATASEASWVVAGKSQYNYGLQVLETIAAGGRISTIVAGGEIKNILAGAYTTTVAAGATAFNNPAGSFSVTVGAGALTLTTASGAMALSAGAGAVGITSGLAMTLTAGLAMTLTASVAITLTAPQVLLGGPAAILGVVRGVPLLPPGTPTLDYILGIPLLGSMLIRSV